MAVIETTELAVLAELRKSIHIKFIEEEISFVAPSLPANIPTNTPPNNLTNHLVPPTLPKTFSVDPEPAPGELPWGITAIHAPEAWKMTRGAGARVLIVDGGIDSHHPDLQARIEKGQSFLSNIPNFFDDNGHGSHIAGVIAADGGSGAGLVGIAPEARLLIGKACNAGMCNTISVTEAIDWGISEKVDVINLSIGGDHHSKSEAEALTRAEQAGVIVVASSGNEGLDHVSFPANISTVLAVGSINAQMEKAKSSQWGPELDVVAPGVEIYSTVPVGTGHRATVHATTTTSSVDLPSLWVGHSAEPVGRVEGDTVYVGHGTIDEVQGKDLSGKIVLMRRGLMPYKEKLSHLTAQGINGKDLKAVVIFNNEPGIFSLKMTEAADFPVFNIEESRGLEILELLNKSIPVHLSLGLVATNYEFKRGTSMACPHATGIATLLRSFNKKLTPQRARDLIKSTATPIGLSLDNKFGMGLVNAEAALTKASLSP